MGAKAIFSIRDAPFFSFGASSWFPGSTDAHDVTANSDIEIMVVFITWFWRSISLE
jgi:hypothetical protein